MAVGIDAVLNDDKGYFDISVDPETGDILSSDSFDTAITVSLLTDARATPDEELRPAFRRGWIGSQVQEMGSTIWLLDQERVRQTTLNDLANRAELALLWMITDQYAVQVRGFATATIDSVELQLDLEKPNTEVERRFFGFWQNTGVNSGT